MNSGEFLGRKKLPLALLEMWSLNAFPQKAKGNTIHDTGTDGSMGILLRWQLPGKENMAVISNDDSAPEVSP